MSPTPLGIFTKVATLVKIPSGVGLIRAPPAPASFLPLHISLSLNVPVVTLAHRRVSENRTQVNLRPRISRCLKRPPEAA